MFWFGFPLFFNREKVNMGKQLFNCKEEIKLEVNHVKQGVNHVHENEKKICFLLGRNKVNNQ
jgi:hypothetical protein